MQGNSSQQALLPGSEGDVTNSFKVAKEDSDDTSSDGNADSDNYEVNARRNRRAARRQYKQFIQENRKFWLSFNLAIIFFSLGFALGTYFILEMEEYSDTCGGINIVLWAVICLHFVNLLVSLVNICGLEIKLCNSNMVCCFSIFELTVLVWMQVTYFRSQEDSCMTNAPVYYFWLMLQILVVYLGMVLVVCHFFRKFCQDPEEEELEMTNDPQDIENHRQSVNTPQ
uniref:Uncharacterized protein n=1 Tax=Strombidium rassoulzadegani TaxID=1082188 RepID=A0A7S3CN82_9SPIT|mmetsp:Transcript_17824/g.30228  ORF Transcript_17824/g.30228 Transcript_17824/m.30228 type:complete len:227 (+) Transcript_17824:19-699(+)